MRLKVIKDVVNAIKAHKRAERFDDKIIITAKNISQLYIELSELSGHSHPTLRKAFSLLGGWDVLSVDKYLRKTVILTFKEDSVFSHCIFSLPLSVRTLKRFIEIISVYHPCSVTEIYIKSGYSMIYAWHVLKMLEKCEIISSLLWRRMKIVFVKDIDTFISLCRLFKISYDNIETVDELNKKIFGGDYGRKRMGKMESEN